MVNAGTFYQKKLAPMQRRGQRARPGAEVPDETEASAPEQVELRRGPLVRSKNGALAYDFNPPPRYPHFCCTI